MSFTGKISAVASKLPDSETSSRFSPEIFSSAVFRAAEIYSERSVRQMRAVILIDSESFLVIVVLITDVPVNVFCQTNCQTHFRRVQLKRIRGNNVLRQSRKSVALSGVFADAVTRVKRNPFDRAGEDIEKEIIVAHIELADAFHSDAVYRNDNRGIAF